MAAVERGGWGGGRRLGAMFPGICARLFHELSMVAPLVSQQNVVAVVDLFAAIQAAVETALFALCRVGGLAVAFEVLTPGVAAVALRAFVHRRLAQWRRVTRTDGRGEKKMAVCGMGCGGGEERGAIYAALGAVRM